MAANRRSKPDPRRAVAYIRVSTDDQHLGPEAQRAALEEWAAAREVVIVATFEDLGVSGGASLDRSPGLLEAIAAVKTERAGLLVAAKRDRLARDVVKAAVLEQIVEKAGAVVVTADGDDGAADDPSAWLLRTLKDAFAQYERLVIGARTKAALGVKKRRGEKLGGDLPFGYRVASDGATLDHDPEEQAVLTRIRALRAEGLSLRAVAARLDREGVTARAGTPWYAEKLSRVLRFHDARAGTA